MSSKNSPSLTSLRAFSVAGNCLSVTGAAQQLGVTQSAVSRQIKALEDSLSFNKHVTNSAAKNETEEEAMIRLYRDRSRRVVQSSPVELDAPCPDYSRHVMYIL